MDVKQVELYACGKCGKCYQDVKFAEDCCKPYHCEICGIETKRYILKCETCAENARFEKLIRFFRLSIKDIFTMIDLKCIQMILMKS